MEVSPASASAHSRLTAFQVLQARDPGVAKRALAVRVNGELRDTSCEVSETDTVEPVLPEDPEALEIYRHSTAHLLAAAVLDLFPGTKLGAGPALKDDPKGGFYYDFLQEKPFTPDDLARIEKRMREMVKQNVPFRRVEMTREEALQKFSADELKCYFISEKGGENPSFYTLGDQFIDFCRGPHVPSAGRIKAFKLLSVAGAYWLGDERNPQMQRIYGTSFFTQEELDAWLQQREEAARRDHRRLGKELDLFSFTDEVGSGLALFHPKGALILHLLQEFLYEELFARDYQLVRTPHVASSRLWETSGHTAKYRGDMYPPMQFEDEPLEYQLKPMNCPFHIQIYKSQPRSYRELPLRYAEMGTVYRYERSGVQHGLLRVRGFTQDDAHLFCTPETLEAEIIGCLEFAQKVYATFGFEYRIELSVRDPENHAKYLGGPEVWALAEAALTQALDRLGLAYTRVEGEAAFYGPKIDIKVIDAIRRTWQLATIQVDFNLPQRFGLEYIGADNRPHPPIMVHRAILGSLERFFGLLIEHFGGRFPVWLAPVQVAVLPIADRWNDRAAGIAQTLRQVGLRVEVDARSEKIGAKIRQAQLRKVPYMVILGDREAETGTLAVRTRSEGDIGTFSMDDFIARVTREVQQRVITP
ncbi:threonyl-tRNA synthetase [Chloracidobacterium thermophilum B]|jgi:threonyl-tRNA synthetase|uniref:Threonine--tRNA ligase n=1 Tax=Chloracidobacterium thermophilum (strain B) TaxID=981222 RepID=G2LE03_CHLTF|nr:threonyl-tRNA synthetase [Chloracidobacterium thermophilum B]